jgi:hypothetical protein
MPEKPDNVVRMPAPEKPAGDAGCVIRIGNQAFRIQISASVTDISGAPEPDVIPIDSAKTEPAE